MQPILDDVLTVILVCLVITVFAVALILFRPWKRRHRHRKRHSQRPKIDLFEAQPSGPSTKADA